MLLSQRRLRGEWLRRLSVARSVLGTAGVTSAGGRSGCTYSPRCISSATARCVRACVRVHGATAVDVVVLLISASAPVVCVRVWWVQEDVDAVSTAVRLAEAAADAEAVALLAKSGGAAAVQGSQAGQTGEQGDAAVMAKESEPGMVSARMETGFSFVLQGLSGIGIETHAVGMRHLSAK